MMDFLFLKTIMADIWVDVSIANFFLDPVAAVDVLTASKNDEKLVETRTVHFA